MWAARTDTGWAFGDIAPEALTTLEAVPLLLTTRDPRVVERLHPETYAEDADEREWRRHAGEELRHLFASREELVRGDLARMRELPAGRGKFLLIPDAHVSGWLAALNAARLALYALNDLEPEWMAGKERERMSAQQRMALARIHLLAELQTVLLGERTREPHSSSADEDEDADESSNADE
ncbi:MAG: DUF2017 family protein [Planctomycetes bacterium]|nr:DUF2017 family protein [Planctomycetota bacterium]